MDMIEEKEGKICLDLGHIAAFRYVLVPDLKEMLIRKYYMVNLNVKVANYLVKRFGYTDYKELKQIFLTDILIITKGKEEIEIIGKDYDYILKNNNINYNEKDPTGAGDLLFSHYIVANIIKNNKRKTHTTCYITSCMGNVFGLINSSKIEFCHSDLSDKEFVNHRTQHMSCL